MKIEQEMTIERAVKHFSWRLKQPKMIPNQKDEAAFNCIIHTLNQNYDYAVIEHALFTKLLIEKLMMLTIGGQRPLKSAIDIIKEDILSKSLSAWARAFANQVPLIRLKNVFDEEYVRVPRTGNAIKDAVNVVKAKQHLYQSYNEKLYEAAQPYTIEEFEGFIKKLIFDLQGEYKYKP